MARVDKYYGTNVMLYGDKISKIRELGYKGTHSQFRVVCKAKSKAEANRMAESYGFGKKVFHPDYTSETGNETEIEMANRYDFIICLNGTLGNEFVGIESII
ncbi:hypothetical protein EXM63_03780 [Clostridium botulinum]|uniref:Uncharacterized protein n=1 Tax=Clostridium botulinum TaxID=1491 RepID=A0A6M0SYZ7_CLOBO|nr:hypothetical protein [Clostridium botulinum]NFI74437.1 hypothetical protein [Clostridium sporogenes]NFP62345.1 hypothetical protein [Clostridium sporogenes]NFU95503.1 hypothetical protein [Clostridium sporogenes]NFV68177.1 hypothetical protein [Clostridium botulinum]